MEDFDLKKFECHIDIKDDNSQVISMLNQACQLSNVEIKQAISKGALWLTRNNSTQRLRRIKKPLKANDTLHFYYDENVLQQIPNEAKLIEDCHHYSVWYKPYGMLSQGSKWSDHCTISRWVQQHLKPERSVFIVHRLDRAATGLILIAHSKNAARLLSKMFEQHNLEKHYHIIVHGDLSQRIQPEIITKTIDDKSAQSTFSHLEYHAKLNMSLVDVKIDSGRKHQIRKHAASIDCPVVGDRLHGDDANLLSSDYQTTYQALNLQLCAQSLSFICPIEQVSRSFILPRELTPSFNKVEKSIAVVAD